MRAFTLRLVCVAAVFIALAIGFQTVFAQDAQAGGDRTAARRGAVHGALPKVVRVENGGLLFTDNQAGVTGTDTGYSLPLGAKTLWLFGDAFLVDPHKPDWPSAGGVSNCGLLVPAGHGASPLSRAEFLADAQTGLARQLIPNLPGEGFETRLWPFGGWFDASRKRVYVYYAIVKLTGGGGPLDFHVAGQGLAGADVSDPASMRFTRLPGPDGQSIWWRSEAGPLFGDAVLAPAAGDSIYLIGSLDRGGHHFGRLARVRKDRIADPAAYEYFSGSAASPAWSPRVSDSVNVEGLEDFPAEISVSWNAYLGGYLAVHSEGIFSYKAKLSLAPQPWGPYKRIAEVPTPRRAFAQAFCYAAKEHPELSEQRGKVVYVTYADSWRYWLQLLKVTLQR